MYQFTVETLPDSLPTLPTCIMQQEQQENANTNVIADMSGQEAHAVALPRGHQTLTLSVLEQTSPKQVTVEPREPQPERKRVPPDHAEPQQKPTHLRQLHTREPFVV